MLNLFPERWEQFQTFFDGSIIDRVSQHIVRLNRPSNLRLKDILALKLQIIHLRLDSLFNSEDLEDILNQDSIRAVLNRAADYYRCKIHKISLPLRIAFRNQQTSESASTQRLLRLENELTTLKKTVNALLEVVQITIPELTLKPTISDTTYEEILSRYLQENRAVLETDYERPQIITDSDDLGKLSTVAEAFQTICSLEIGVLRLGRRRVPEHIVLTAQRT